MDKDRIEKPSLLAPLVLAYIGDSVYEVFVREKLILQHSDMPAYKLHRLAIKYVCAHAQSNSILAIERKRRFTKEGETQSRRPFRKTRTSGNTGAQQALKRLWVIFT